jgi:hypothetical protein
MTSELKKLLDLREENAPISKDMEAEAVAAKVMEWWLYGAVQRARTEGMTFDDIHFTRRLIDTFNLSCSMGDVERAILARCAKHMDYFMRWAVTYGTNI